MRKAINVVCFVAGVLMAVGAAQATVTIETVVVGNVGNADNVPDTTGYGAVDYSYNIGKYEITVGQYVEFLNYKEIDKSTPLLMSPAALAANNIVLDLGVNPFLFRTSERSYDNNPVAYVSFWNACRFVNWLSNGQGNGDMETGTYTLNGYNDSAGSSISRNPGARWFIPTIDEWYKAAYYTGAGYLQNVGASAYDTTGQYGNGWEWSESVGVATSLSTGRILGGGYGPLDISVPVDFKGSSLGDPSRSSGPSLPWEDFEIPADNGGFGFRVAEIPEPATLLLLSLGGLAFRQRQRV
jgi:hypothetical protein